MGVCLLVYGAMYYVAAHPIGYFSHLLMPTKQVVVGSNPIALSNVLGEMSHVA